MDLSLVNIEELMDEILRRCKSGVIIFERDVDHLDPQLSLRYSGGGTSAVGLAEIARDTISNKVQKTFVDKGEESEG